MFAFPSITQGARGSGQRSNEMKMRKSQSSRPQYKYNTIELGATRLRLPATMSMRRELRKFDDKGADVYLCIRDMKFVSEMQSCVCVCVLLAQQTTEMKDTANYFNWPSGCITRNTEAFQRAEKCCKRIYGSIKTAPPRATAVVNTKAGRIRLKRQRRDTIWFVRRESWAGVQQRWCVCLHGCVNL